MELSCAGLQKMLLVENDSGILIPPPDIRSMVDKVARFVASIKPRLEKIIAKNAGMRSYSFLNAADPYYAYYQQLLSEFRAQNGWPAVEKTRPKGGPVTETDFVIEFLKKSFEQFEETEWVDDTVVVSPFTGELITTSNMSQHMQDLRYKEQRETLFAKIKEAASAQDDQISETIVELAREHPDVFGTMEEELSDAVIDEIIPFSETDEPERKRQRRFDASLLDPEDEFLADHLGRPACINVWAEQTLDLLEISVDSLSESISSFKDKIAREIDVPANKMRLELIWMPGPFKDDLSLAYYNVAGGGLLSLSW